MDFVHRTSQLLSGLIGLLAVAPMDARAQTITVTPSNATILVGETLQFTQSGALTVTSIAAGGWHTCLLLSDRSLRCVGRNNQGQLGNGALNDTSDPVAVVGLDHVAGVRGGEEHTCAVIEDGTMQCWGANYTGALGIGSAGVSGGVNLSWTPTPVRGIATAIAAALGGFHTCALLADRTVQCWGDNHAGQVGNGERTTAVTAPVAVTGLGSVSALTAGGAHTCALMPDGTVRCWGRNDDGQLGTGDRTSSSTPVSVSGLRPVALTAGDYHTCALLPDGTVQCWGRNDVGQLGQPTTTSAFLVPTTVPGVTDAVAVSAGYSNSCALLSNGTTRCWGQNRHGEVGDGTMSPSSMPVEVTGILDPGVVSVGGYHTCALVANTAVRCWGRGDEGQLGNGGTTSSPTAVKVSGTGLTWTSSAPMVAGVSSVGLARGLGRGSTNITVTAASGASVNATLTVKEMLTLSVMAEGDGLGTVTSAPGGINCGSTCWFSYLSDSQVTLAAAPAANSTLVGWAGCDSVAGLTCRVSMNAARSVTATFNLKRFALDVSKTGLGRGTVNSSPAGINCGPGCSASSASYVIGTTVILTASPSLGSVFVNGWSGCDAVSGAFGQTCTVTVQAARAVTATFVLGVPLP